MPGATQQIEIVLGTGFLIFGVLTTWLVMERWFRVNGPKSARIANTGAWSSLAKKIGGLIASGDEVLVPAGCGRYPFALNRRQRDNWERQIEQWTERGVRLTPIIISPADDALAVWQKLVDRVLPTFRVCILIRDLASPEDKIEIDRLIRFHPVLILRNNKPLCMWVENDHPPDTCVANNVQYVAPQDMNDFELARFNRYLKVLRRLTDATRQPPHLRELSRSDRTGSSSVASSTHAA